MASATVGLGPAPPRFGPRAPRAACVSHDRILLARTAWDRGQRIVKISQDVRKEEQRWRFLARIEEPGKDCKLSAVAAR